MVRFIIIEPDNYMSDLYKKIIKKFVYTHSESYDIVIENEYNRLTMSKLDKLDGEKIYIINTVIKDKSGFELARKIRSTGDTKSQIIMVAPKNTRYGIGYAKNTLLLNVVKESATMIKDLLESLEVAYKIATNDAVLTFSYFDEVYRIPYDDIYYIAKNFYDDTVTIYTKDDTYVYYKSLKRMQETLNGDARFIRCHRSCIVNMYKISSIDCKNNIIIFNNGDMTNLLSPDLKRYFIDRVKHKNVINE